MADELPRRSGRRGHAGRRRSNAKHHDDVGHFGDAARPPVLLGRTSDTGQDVRTSRLDLGAGSSKVEQRQPMCPQEQSRQLAPPSASSSVVAPGCAARTTAPQQADAAVPTWSPQGFFLAPWVYLQNPLVAQSWGAVATAPLPTAAAAGLQTANTQPADAAVLGVAQQPMQQQMQQHMQQLLQVQQMQQMQQQMQAQNMQQRAQQAPSAQQQAQSQGDQQPPQLQQQPLALSRESTPPWTTVIMRNLPNGYTRSMLLGLLDRTGFAGRYDFVYLPIDFKTEVGLGFAFVDFITSGDAELARQRLSGFRDWAIPSAKVLEVGWSSAEQQGLAANVERYRNSSVMHDSVPEEFRPLKLVEGRQSAFPPPTRKVWPPHESFGCRARR